MGVEDGRAELLEGRLERGLVGAKPGTLRRLTIPSELGYGDRTIPGIPPGSTLIFEIEVRRVELKLP